MPETGIRVRTAGAGPIGVVIVDGDPGQRRSIAAMIAGESRGRFVAQAVASPEEARLAAGTIVVADLDPVGGPGALSGIGAAGRTLIATSANGSLNTAVAAMKGGAADFLAKPIGAKALIERLEAALAAPADAPAPVAARDDHQPHTGDFAGFVGHAPAMRAVYEQIARMAPSRAPVFVTGESGTGKELCAEAIHAIAFGSDSARRPFVAINCSAIPKDLMESEIFGHVRGAFTGASEHRAGAAELADGGTLFLDEIAEMDLGLQAKLLRFLQSGTIRRVGASESKAVDVRIVCATNRDPAAEVAAGRFRADLYYRLHVLPIHMPPLRERGSDIVLIAGVLLQRIAADEGRRFRRFTEDAEAALIRHDWPGNVRELANAVRRAVVLHDGEAVTETMLALPAPTLSPSAAGIPTAFPAAAAAAILPLWQEEKRAIEAAIAASGGNIGRAAAALGISPSTIYRKRQSWPVEAGIAG